jgi:hypothetical protein
VHIGIEPHPAQDQFPAFHACPARTVGAGVEERAAQTVAARMGEDQETAHGRVRWIRGIRIWRGIVRIVPELLA